MKTLVLGQGKLGREIVIQTGWDFLSRRNHQIDALAFDEWKILLRPYDVVVNCIANTNTYSDDERSHRRINYEFVSELSDYCSSNSIKLVHISTDYVYAENGIFASENDIPKPANNWYSYTKLLADEYIQLRNNDYLICRLSHKDRPFTYDHAWTDVKTNADYTDVITDLVIQLIRAEAVGVYNVGTESKTIYDLASQTRKVSPSIAPPHIPKNVTMNLNRLHKTLYTINQNKENQYE